MHSFYRVTVLVERMSDAECATYDPLGLDAPYWQRLWHPDLSVCNVSEGPTYVVAPDLKRLIQVRLTLSDAKALPEIGACEVANLCDEDVPDIDGLRVLVRLDVDMVGLPPDLEEHLERLPFLAYRVTPHPSGATVPEWSILGFDWSEVLPNLEWRPAA